MRTKKQGLTRYGFERTGPRTWAAYLYEGQRFAFDRHILASSDFPRIESLISAFEDSVEADYNQDPPRDIPMWEVFASEGAP